MSWSRSSSSTSSDESSKTIPLMKKKNENFQLDLKKSNSLSKLKRSGSFFEQLKVFFKVILI